MPTKIGDVHAWHDEKLGAMFVGADDYPSCTSTSFEFPSLETIWGSGYSAIDWQLDAYFSTLVDTEPPTSVIQDDSCISNGDVPGVTDDDMGTWFRPTKQAVAKLEGKLSNDHHQEPIVVAEKRPNFNSCLEKENNGRGRMLSRKEISRCFYMPINQAAKELNVGITHLKKRCRELGIRRWPHRKLSSLRTLIGNFQELREEEDGRKVREAIELLEREKRLMEEVPDLQLEDKTKRLRQACFKANYKKRKQSEAIAFHEKLLCACPAASRMEFVQDIG